MRFLVFAEPQGNLAALEALLQVGRRAKPDEWICLGNAVGEGAQPQKCVEAMRKVPVHLVQGPLDLAALGKPVRPAHRELGDANAALLKPGDLRYLRSGGPPRRLVAAGKRVLLTSDPSPQTMGTDVVLHPSDEAFVAQEGALLRVGVGRVHGPHDAAPFVLFDAATGEAVVKRAVWNVRTPGETRHL